MDSGRDRGLLGFFLRLLTGKCRDFGAVLGHLVEQKLTLRADQCRVCVGGWREVGGRIISAVQCRMQSGNIELLGEKVIVKVIAFRRIHGRIELDEHIACLDRLLVLNLNGSHHAGLEWLNNLSTTARNYFSGGRRNDVNGACPGPNQRSAEKQYDCGPDCTANW